MSCIKVPAQQNDSTRTSEINEDLLNVTTENKKLIMSANKVFGKNWSHAVTNTTLDFIDSYIGKYYVGCQATVKVQLSNGIFHEDVGYSNVEASLKGVAVEKARLTAITNALKKVLTCFVEMEAELRESTNDQNTTANISRILKTKFPPMRPTTPPPPGQSTPKTTRTSERLEKIQGKVANSTSGFNNEPAASGLSNEKIEDIIEDELDVIFETSDVQNVPPVLNVPPPTSVTSVTMTEEELRQLRKRKQREKQEEFKRQMKEKEKRDRQNLRLDAKAANPKY